MIAEEFLNGGTLVHHWSDQGLVMLQVETGAEYEDAVDVVPCPYTYIETDRPIDAGEDEEEADGPDEN